MEFKKENCEELIDELELWRQALDGSGVGVWTYNVKTGESKRSDTFYKLIGYKDLENTFQAMQEITHPDDEQIVSQIKMRYAAGLIEEHSIDYRLLCADGKYRWFNDRGRLVRFGETRLEANIVGTITDITSRIATLNKLRLREQEFKALVENSPDIFARVNRNRELLYINRIVEKYFRDRSEKLLGRELASMMPPDANVGEYYSQIAKAFEQGCKTEAEFSYVDFDGSTKKFEARITPEFDHNGIVSSVLISARDVSNARELEDMLRRSESRMKALLDNIPHIAWLKDAGSRFLYVNKSFLDYQNKLAEDVIGKNDYEVWSEEEGYKYIAEDVEVMKTGKPLIMEEKIFVKGKEHWHEIIKSPVFDCNGKVIGTTGLSIDITKHKETQKKMRDLYKELEKRCSESRGLFGETKLHSEGEDDG
ncbi:MAG: PAS domain S-box protein [Chloroflexota bacterium]